MRRSISRREFNRLAAATGALAIVPFGSAGAQVRFPNDPFQLGALLLRHHDENQQEAR